MYVCNFLFMKSADTYGNAIFFMLKVLPLLDVAAKEVKRPQAVAFVPELCRSASSSNRGDPT